MIGETFLFSELSPPPERTDAPPFVLDPDEPMVTWSVDDPPWRRGPPRGHSWPAPRPGVVFQAREVEMMRKAAELNAEVNARAACRSVDTAVFFPRRRAGRSNHGVEAKAVCRGCAVLIPCLEGALDRLEEFGIWGGAGEDERRHLRRAFVARDADPERWRGALEGHIQHLEGEAVPVVNRTGPGATHGLRVTYNRGCRCVGCIWGMKDDVEAISERKAAA